ncbi:PAS domain-containing sensor histidine kinase [Haloplanus natans]|uniref:PAS domain-containing sensor histidine kinase n=1 Tax=Haloplanus natans TaxID=376171 RepID=UPI000677A049|nr:ATP-binding protein [Haloplanus natans]
MPHPTSTPSIDVLYVGDDASTATTEGIAHADDRLSVRRVASVDDALAALDADRPVDCAVIDTRFSAGPLATLAALDDADASLPVLFYFDSAHDVTVGDAFDAGATDCVRYAPGGGHGLLAHRIRDAVASHRTERRLRTQRSQYRQLFDDAPVMFAVFRSVDDEPVIEDCNDRFCDRLGYDRDALVDRSVWNLYADESMERAVDGFDSGRRGTFGQQERTLVAADGERVETIFRASPRVDRYGDVIGTVGLYLDITERKRRERTLERLHDVTRNLLYAESRAAVAEAVTDAVGDVLGYPRNLVRLVDDGELRSVAITDAAERMLGDRPVYAVGEGTAGRAFARGETLVYDDVRTVDDDYDRHGARASMFVPIGDHGVLSIGDTEVGTFDRSDRHLAEVFAANAATALTLLDRTRNLERQNDRLEEFASVVSHDLRTPLTVVDGSLELARARYDDDDLDRAARSLDRAFDLIEDLLTLARRDDAPDRRPIELSALAEACWRTADTADATLVVDGEPTVQADESRLRRLLENLFRNSVEHGSTSDLTVALGSLPDGFYVEDDGSGLPDDDVFEAGYTTGDDGTGLGLAIVERIAEEHGWSVDAVDADGGGARFEFRG